MRDLALARASRLWDVISTILNQIRRHGVCYGKARLIFSLYCCLSSHCGLITTSWSAFGIEHIKTVYTSLLFKEMSSIQRQVSHGLNKPMFGYLTPKSAEDSSTLRKHFVAAAGEFVGTFLFLFTAYLGMCHASTLPQKYR